MEKISGKYLASDFFRCIIYGPTTQITNRTEKLFSSCHPGLRPQNALSKQGPLKKLRESKVLTFDYFGT